MPMARTVKIHTICLAMITTVRHFGVNNSAEKDEVRHLKNTQIRIEEDDFWEENKAAIVSRTNDSLKENTTGAQ